MFAVFSGAVIIRWRITLAMLGISPNAELGSIGRSYFKRSARAYRWCESRRISVISTEEDLAMVRPLELKRMIPHDVRNQSHVHPRGEY